MDPLLFKKQLEPLNSCDNYKLIDILNICYPLRGIWDWNMIDSASNSILQIFKLVHLNQEEYLQVEPDWITNTYVKEKSHGFEYDEKWGICWRENIPFKESYLYTSLDDLLKEPEIKNDLPTWDDYEVSSDESSDEVTVSLSESECVKDIEFKTIERDQKWKDNNPAFNPRFVSDLENGYIKPPSGFTVENTISIIREIQKLKDDEFLFADGSGNKHDSGISEFGLYGKERCMYSVKMIRFFEQHASEYSLDIDVSQWVEKCEKRTNVWKWIRIGPGFYRDFDWMFLGDRDCISKTIDMLLSMGYTPLSNKRKSGESFDFDPNDIFKLSPGKCLNIDTGEAVVSKNADIYGFISSDMNKTRVKLIRGFIFKCFVEKYPDRWIPGKKNRWSKDFFDSLKEGVYINFDTLKPVNYTASMRSKYYFSRFGFAISKDQKNFKISDIERAYKEYKNLK